ncbi:PREDICTED: uncharacterized protein KIAA1614 homolog [Nipponia nippon]|uniref:uncharacterized protein KIAA1614 homolog n=1 Tax=Nipponia nippon TaxID=128390 RepID=UPI000510F0D5|nr:PREDICTED: uncharacterized protein KIAA1614 homolog [Nipponia nippon]
MAPAAPILPPRDGSPGTSSPSRWCGPDPPGTQHRGVRRSLRQARGGHMEGGSPAETRRAPRPPKQHGQAPTPKERPEATRGPHAILESKVKALKEKRGAGRPGTPVAAPEHPSPKKPRSRRGKPGMDVGAVEPRTQLRTYLTDGLLPGGEPVAGGPLAPHAGTPGLWRVPAAMGDVPAGTELPRDEGGGSQGSASPHEAPPLEEEARTPPRDQGGPSASPTTAEGWERLSLAERVVRNRRLLQEVLGLAAAEVPASDGDWDSGVSLQDAEGCRAFVPGQELELSPRHEQAKQLLQRARMKARTNPLRASHDILLLPAAAAPRPREPSGRPSIAPRDGGSLSDSSSGESSCGQQRRPRGPSPSRVRFEDESARDAEVRYLERLALRARTLGPRGSPLWILPSRQRIHTETIKETYIGNVTYIDEVDSALESTDTSDGCRTDSEEAGPRSPHPRGHRDPRARGHRAPRAGPQPEPRAGKGTCAASGGPCAGDGGSGGTTSRLGAACPPLLERAGSQEEGDPRQHLGDSEGGGKAACPLQQPSEPPDPSSQPGAGTPVLGTHLPAPPTTKKACSQVPCRKVLFSSGSRRASSQGARGPEPDGGSAAPPQPGGTAGPGEQRGPCSPRWLPGSPLHALSTNNCNNNRGQDRQDPPGMGRGGYSSSRGSCRDARSTAAAAAPVREHGTGVSESEGPLAACAAREPVQPASRKGSSASASGLKKLLCSLSQSTKQRLGRFRCYSMEQLPAPGGTPPDGPGMKKSPSLQSLRLVSPSPFCQPRKAASVQSLHSLLGKAPRASAYLLPQTTADRKGGSGPRRSLSVEDIGVPGRLHAVGRMVEVFPDGTSQLELQRPPHGAFGFCVTSGHGRPDTGVYVQEMADAGTAKLYAGLLGVGDKILQVNGAAVSGLGLARIRELLLRADTLSLRVLRHRPAPR